MQQTQIKMGEYCSLIISIDLRNIGLEMADSMCIMTHFILPLREN